MPFVIKAADQTSQSAGGVTRRTVLPASATPDGRIVIERWRLAPGSSQTVDIALDSVGWLEMQAGEGRLGEVGLAATTVVLLPPGTNLELTASSEVDTLVSVIPDARRFDASFDPARLGLKSFDWSREPVLQSEHDGRKRIYLATEGLFSTSAIKGEMIIYPPDATCPEHHHEGAEHYQYVLRGSGVAVLDGAEQRLEAGDLLYNFQDEPHWFYNPGREDFVFVEYFVPGACRTVWAPKAKICAWLPTGGDLAGRKPSRDIPYHSHGDGTPV